MAIGDLSTAAISTVQLVPTGSSYISPSDDPKVVHGTGSIFVMAYDVTTASPRRHIGLATFSISTAGIITSTILDETTISTGSASGGAVYDLAKITDGMVAIAWQDRNDTNSPKINTYSVNSTGGMALVQSVEIDTATNAAFGYLFLSKIGRAHV